MADRLFAPPLGVHAPGSQNWHGWALLAPFAKGVRVGLAHHWLALSNTLVLLFVALSFAAPALMAAGFTSVANVLYDLYGYTCHQWPFRSFFLFGPHATYSFDTLARLIGEQRVYNVIGNPELGYKLAFCQRDLGIYTSILLGGLAFALHRNRARPLGFLVYALLCAPIALDGFTQLFGWRESTWELRLVTGALFGLATVWFIYPRVDRVVALGMLGAKGAERHADGRKPE